MLEDRELLELLDMAFQLACFLVRDYDGAARIAQEALERAPSTYGGRGGYTPKDRCSKVVWQREHCVQRLVMILAERYERRQEAAGTVTSEDMLIRYIAYIVRMGMKVNSFWMITGIGGVLHDYTADQLINMYTTLAPKRAAAKHEANCRSIRGRFINEIGERFGDQLERVVGLHGKDQFRTVDQPKRHNWIVNESLERFTPWYTRHVLAAGCGRVAPVVLDYQGAPHAEHAVEIMRYHPIIEPQCFSNLTSAWGQGAPELHRTIPVFHLPGELDASPGGGNSGGDDRFQAPMLSDAELALLAKEVRRGWDLRGRLAVSAVSVRIDGKHHASVQLNSVEGVRLDLMETPEVVDIVAEAADRPVMATYLFSGSDEDHPSRSFVEHSIGDRIISIVILQPGSVGTPATVDVGYADESHYRREGMAVRSLRREELGKLEKAAMYRMNPLRQKAAGRSYDDLLNEAMLAAMERRPWSKEVDPFAHLSMVVRGLSNDWRHKKFDEVHLDDSPTAINRAIVGPSAERRIAARQIVEKLKALLVTDAAASAILEMLSLQWDPREIRAKLRLTVRQYETTMKRMRRVGRAAGLG